MTLFFQVAHNRIATQSALTQNIFDFHQIFLLERHFEKIISIVDSNCLDLTLPRDCINLVLHEKRDVRWVLNTLEGTGRFAVTGKHVF